MDLYEEQIVNDKYLYEGNWHDLRIREETIKFKEGGSVTIQVRSTFRGPLINTVSKMMAQVLYNAPPIVPHGDISLSWVGFKKEDTMTPNIYSLQFCKSVKCGIDKVRESDGVAFNFVFGSVDNEIGYAASGGFPQRKNRVIGSRISEGWTSENNWLGYMTPDQKPFILNPEKGYIHSANNRL